MTLEGNSVPTKPIERLLFAQGGFCFFCNAELPKAEATVEHLVPSARGGANGDDNCVACCKAINTLLGSMSLKEKIKVVLNQKGNFQCPNGTAIKSLSAVVANPKRPAAAKPKDPLSILVANLKSRGKGKPAKLQSLAADIKSQKLGRTDAEVTELVEKLKVQGKIVVAGTKVTYKL
jgi:hypothetical protein